MYRLFWDRSLMKFSKILRSSCVIYHLTKTKVDLILLLSKVHHFQILFFIRNSYLKQYLGMKRNKPVIKTSVS